MKEEKLLVKTDSELAQILELSVGDTQLSLTWKS